MDVVIYRAKGSGGYLYDMSLNPRVDYEILKRTRKINRMDIISDPIPFEKGEELLRRIYGKSSILGRIVSSESLFINNIFKKHNIKRVEIRVSDGFTLPPLEDISRVEEFIVGKIITLDRLLDFHDKMNISYHEITDIIQALYCERRIKMVPAVKRIRNKRVCFLCSRESCGGCCYGFKDDDILLYAADNYNLDTPRRIEIKKRKLSDVVKNAGERFKAFVNSRKDLAFIWTAPNSFEYDVLLEGIGDVIRKGRKVLYITSNSLIFEVKEGLRSMLKGARIDSTDGFFQNFRELDVAICSYNDYPCFYKAFDLVILDERYSFIEKPLANIYFLGERAAKERGKFVNITCCPTRSNRKIFKGSPEMIEIPVSPVRNPIPEPRMITSRFLEGNDPFIPPMVMDVIKWAMNQNSRIIIFVPDEEGIHRIYYYLTAMEGIERDIVDISTDRKKTPFMAFKKGECKILISTDFKDTLHIMEDVNVIVMYSNHPAYRVDTLVNMAAMAVMHDKRNIGEVVFVSSDESEAMSLAKSTIRGLNKLAWEKGYIKR
ncbi:hypothetical protein [Fonticella tunisiensis]|uniref:Late competence protein required for DNA uptake (Superfamily II DNA/RNA helicase) n=1 Tax=Fonticella tunisiensis TaxID=1096341 RepID=A0A4R7KV76_9CLOT|nr:hypothetical protein [Fonticella tunisiensis]TDT62417.1 late competence protein required for DNA uptake (superfamily II DNA/RNA helicase) [Fonticella tunisiensis]